MTARRGAQELCALHDLDLLFSGLPKEAYKYQKRPTKETYMNQQIYANQERPTKETYTQIICDSKREDLFNEEFGA